MSPSVGNFVHDLVEMAKAMEELPLVQAELTRVKQLADAQAGTIASREDSILRLKSEIEGLQGKVRDAEANRDDAELRFLEADDHIAAFRRLVSAFSTDTVALLKAIDPPKPEPIVEPIDHDPQPVASKWSDEQHAWVADVPTQPSPPQTQTGGGGSGDTLALGQSDSPPTPSQSETTAHVDTPTNTVSPTDPTVSMAPNEGVSVQSDLSPAPSTQPSTPTTASSPDADTPASAPVDDVGYHNEPSLKWTSDWYNWSYRMDRRYGPGWWPQRTQSVG